MRFPTPTERQKREKLGQLLDKGLVSVQLDPRVEGVEVPERFIGQPALVLNLSHRFRAPDLQLDHDAVRVTLSFSGVRSRCVLPWNSIFAMGSAQDDEGFLFTDAVPPEVAAVMAEAPTTPATEDESVETEPERPTLRLIE